jgi:GNAT superfamily N-acetyltransferase
MIRPRAIISYIEKKGWGEIRKLIAYRLKETFRKYVFERNTEILLSQSIQESFQPFPCPPEITIRKAELSDVEKLCQIIEKHHWSTTRKELTDWITKGYPVYVALRENKIIGYTCALLELDSLNRKYLKLIHPRQDDAWGRDAFVLPEYRGAQIYQALSTITIKALKDKGYRRVLATVFANNPSGRTAHKKLGQKEVKEIHTWRIFFYKRVKMKPLKENLKNGQNP